MKNTTFVSAGAGSGKTHRLTQDIVRLVREGQCQSDEIILTTYTEIAAQELREKVRTALYAEGLYEEAANIDNAVIGTIHSVARQLVARYWYLLGISANITILDEENSNFFISQSLSSLPSEDDLKLFDEVLQSFNVTKYVDGRNISYSDFWKEELKVLIGKTYELCISAEQSNKIQDDSKCLLRSVIGWNDLEVTRELVATVVKKLRPIFAAIAAKAKTDKEGKLKTLLDSVQEFEKYAEGKGVVFCLSKFIKLVSSYASPSQKYLHTQFPEEIFYFADLADRLPRCRQVKELIERYIDTIFSLAIKWKGLYEQFKRERCLLDYNDLLVNFNKLLYNEKVVTDIQCRFKVALVDEFQDCSPLLVKTFNRLSELMAQSVWVGDIKQAIYGFRGTNTLLIQSVIDKVREEKEGNKFDSLKECWRSNATIVNFVNYLFVEKVFKDKLSEELIRLDVPQNRVNPPQERDLLHWHFEKGNESALAQQIKKLIDDGTFKPHEIAVLYSDNEKVQDCAAALKRLGVPYNAKLDNVAQNAEANVSAFINAVVSFAANASNELSKAIILNSVVPGCTTSMLLSDRMRYCAQEGEKQPWMADQHILNRISQIREVIKRQSVSEAIETLMVELNLCDLLKHIDVSCSAYAYCAALSAEAANYEHRCANFSLSSTLEGFAQHLHDCPLSPLGDDQGVSVMTYHKSKGLQWRCVILCSLDKTPVDSKRDFFGVLMHTTSSETSLYLVPYALKSIGNNVMDAFEEHKVFKSLRTAKTDEARRLMYVGMTRPKEQLILTTYGTKNFDALLTAIGCDPLPAQSPTSVIDWGGSNWQHACYGELGADEVATTSPATVQVLKQPDERSTAFVNRFISPSKQSALNDAYKVSLCTTFANRLTLTSQDKRDSTIGNFIHHAMYLWNGDPTILTALAASYGVSADVEVVAATIQQFYNWLEQTYGPPTSIERELPFRYVNERGQEINGEIDLVYRTPEGDVLVDYKTYQGKVSHLTDSQSDFCASKYSAQIALYEEALQRHGRTLRARLICYLSLGEVVRFE